MPNPDEEPQPITEDLGRMLYDVVFLRAGNHAVFFDARLKNGVMNTRPESVLPDADRRTEVLQCSYKR